METKHAIYTYFFVSGDFIPEELEKLLQLESFDSWVIDNEGYCSFGFNDSYSPLVEEMMLKTIKPLLDKVDLLREFHDTHKVEMYLEVVCSINKDEVVPSFSPNLDIIDFCHKTRTNIDYDVCLMEDEVEEEAN